jgi:site-specific DNA recombinase
LADIHAERLKLDGLVVTEAEVATALGDFDQLWESLSPREQARVMALLVAQVEYHGGTGKVGNTFQPAGIRLLAEQYATEEAA